MGRKMKDLTNQKFGKLLVLERDYEKSLKRPFWKCQCECGNIKSISSDHLLNRNTKSCGCLNKYQLSGKKFGMWTVLERAEKKSENNKGLWKCLCECGKIGYVNSYNLIHKKSLSCGCIQKKVTIERLTTHNLTNTKLYRIYFDMKRRCYNPNNKRYKDYGGRGISICDEWKNDFMSFYNWSIENNYKEGLSIDRINVNGNYEPSNCRWATKKQQSNNKRNSIFFEFLGIKKTLKEWTDFMNWNYQKYYGRYSRGYVTFKEQDINLIIEKLKGE